jgi:RHS repeat-associated protein
MFSRTMDSRWRLFVVLLSVVALVAGGLTLVRVASEGHSAPAAQAGTAVPVHVVRGRPVKMPAVKVWHRPVTSWPAAGTASVSLAVSAAGSSGRGSAKASAGPSAGSVRAGSTPVWIGPPDAGGATTTAAMAGRDVSGVSGAQVNVASQATAQALGVHGMVLSVAQAGDAASAGSVHVSVSYAGFAQAYGGDYGSRLRLVELPGCALTTPSAAGCQTQKPLGSLNDGRADWVGADVMLPAAAGSSSAAAAVPGATPGIVLTSATQEPAVALAVVASPSGSAGDFASEPLSEQNTAWTAGASSGAYTYQYPVTVPPVPGGLVPSVSLDYDSQATSGLTSSTNNDASWVGDGFDYQPGYIETDYTTCSQDALEPHIADLCDYDAVVTMVLDGQTTQLVYGSGKWAPAADGGQTVKQIGNTWEIIEPNGTQYWFGLNELPGWTTGDPVTNSLWTAPVWEGCESQALCTMPWRANLDYVVDPHGNAIAYFYSDQSNYYAEDNGTTGTGAYVQGGVLDKIEYGLRAGQVYTSTPAAQVNFTTTSGRQDAPTDLTCASGAACSITSPTFWNDDSLSTITTQALENGTLTNVDSYALDTTYPATNDPTSTPSLWLASVTPTGKDGATPITLPPVSFGETPMPNRVETTADSTAGYSDLTRFYLSSITNDAGGVTSITYSAPDPAPCAAGSFPTPDANTAACYPDYWSPPGATSPVQDWFNLYSVSGVTKTDTTGADPPIVTSYTYSGPGWHYDSGAISRSATVTWDQFRGYQTVTTETGTQPDPVTQTTTTYLRGLSQDGPASGPGPAVSVTTSRGQKVTDSNQFAGMALETIMYDGAGTGEEVTDTVDLPWSSSAIVTNPTLDQAAYETGTTSTLVYTALGAGGSRESITDNTYNSSGLVSAVSSIPDTSNAAEDTCTVTSYATNGAGFVDLTAEVSVYTEPCNGSGNGAGTLISQTENFYDGQEFGVVTDGNLTKSAQATALDYFDTTTYTYDEYGRVLTSTNPDGAVTTTAYTPAAGAQPTSVSVTDPMGLVTTTTYDPARDLALTVTSPDGDSTTTAYDALGHKTAEWTAGNPVSGPATTTWSYTVSSTAPSVATENDLEPGGNYLTTDTITDSFGNTREVQAETASGGTDITDTTYDSDGWKALDSGPYYVSGPPSGTLVEAASTSVPDETGYVYDGDGRVIRQVAYDDGTEKYETDTAYGGDYTTVTPPAGGTPETTWTDGRGLTTEIWQYHAGAPVTVIDEPATDYDQTLYTYTAAGKLATITDAAGNQWSYTYDLLGDQLSASDPDAGASTSTYDAAQRLMTVTDARGKTTAYTYDADGRKTAEYDTTGGAAEDPADELASWTYDTLAKGMPTSSTAYEGGASYTQAITGYNAQGLPEGTDMIIPSSQGALAGTYTQTDTYAPTGQETSYTDSAAGGLPAETVTIGYDSAGDEDSLTGASPYVDSLSYTDLDQPLQYTMGTSTEPVYVTDSYDLQTGSLTQQDTQTGTAQTEVDDLNYTYNDVQDVTSEADSPAGDTAATDVQCFQYDYLNRLVQAWAQASTGCPATPSASAEGGAAPYWESYSYNTIGNLTGITSTTPAGAVTTTSDTYPAAGAAHPHGITGQFVTTSAGTTSTSYGYDSDGDLTSVNATSQDQALTWNDAGQLTQDTITPAGGPAQDTSYIYEADGTTLLLAADPGSTTLYLPDEELSLNTSTGVVTGTRYYSLGSTTVATLTAGSGLSYVVGDQQGTDSLAISASTLNLARRYYDPYGNPRGTIPSSFPTGEKGFIGGADDPATSLTDLGAREYQPATGSFISIDTILNPYDPQDLNAYTYAADNPATESDPTGQSPTPTQSTYYIRGCINPITGQEMSYTATAQTEETCAEALSAMDPTASGGDPAAINVNYYTYTWNIGPVAYTGSPEAAIKKFEANPQTIFPFGESCPKFYNGEVCELNVSDMAPGGWVGGEGKVRVTTSSTSVTFTVISGGYMDAPGSQITFSMSESHGELYYSQHAESINESSWKRIGYSLGVVQNTWWQSAINLAETLGGSCITHVAEYYCRWPNFDIATGHG